MPEDRDAEHHRVLVDALEGSLDRPRTLLITSDPRLVGFPAPIRTGLIRALGATGYIYSKDKERKYRISPEQFISNLKSRFELCKKESLKDVSWADVERSLSASPEDLFSIYRLEETGGEPQLVDIEGNEFVFEDRSKESPIGRRNMNFEQSDIQRKSFGSNVRFQSSFFYKIMQESGEYDSSTFSWLETDGETRELKEAMVGGRKASGPYVVTSPETCYSPRRGWRGSVRIKIVQ